MRAGMAEENSVREFFWVAAALWEILLESEKNWLNAIKEVGVLQIKGKSL